MNNSLQAPSIASQTKALPVPLANIQALRALAVGLVILVHLQVNETRIFAHPMLSPWLYHGVSGVDLFFVISGFIMVYISHQKFGDARRAGLFVLNRAARIYPPAILFTALAVLGFILAGTTDKWFAQNNILFSFLLLPQTQPPLLGVSWTLIHELYFYLLFAVFMLGRFRLLPLWLILWAVVAGLAQWAGVWSHDPWTLIAFHPLTFEFILGAITGLFAVYCKPRFGAAFMLMGAVLFVTGALWIGFPSAQGYPQGWGRVIAFAPGAACLVYGAFALEAAGRWRAPKMAVALGNWSYSLYLSHLLVISTLVHVWQRFLWHGPVAQWLFPVISLCAVITVSALSYYGFERPTLRVVKAGIRRLFNKGRT
jgi:exopolysaccharide production protein ExoZ